MREKLAEIIMDAPKCQDKLLINAVTAFLNYARRDASKVRPKYNVRHFRDAFRDTDLDGLAMYNLIKAFTATYREARFRYSIKEANICRRALARTISSYVENPTEDTLRRTGDFACAIYGMLSGKYDEIKRRGAERYKNVMWI